MPHYLGSADYDHRAAEAVGVLLVNLGTPAAPTTGAVRRYLKQFLSDPRVIEMPRGLWWLILNGVILRIRPRKSAHAYRQIWTEQGSPLLVHSNALAQALHAQLQTSLLPAIKLAVAMTYGEPAIEQALRQLHRANVRKLVVLPLYPQYSATSTAAVFDAVAKVLNTWRWLPALRFITQYHDDANYIAALAQSVRQHWQTQPRQHLVMSFHGLPKRYLLAGDPYHCQCHKTARLLAEQLQLQQDEWSVTFQSRVTREAWLGPYTDETLLRYAQQGPKRVTLICPGFAVDCLETLEEIAIRNREDFMAAGGESFDYIPALNEQDVHVAALAQLIAHHTQGWLAPVELDAMKLIRARQLGASQ